MKILHEGKGLLIPETYLSKLDLLETERAIKLTKDTFERELARALSLTRVSAPLFVRPETGLNDDLNGVERPVQFDILDLKADVQIVQSLAKWKRMALGAYGFAPDTGLYTDMNAIRRDEDLDNLHSVYVDQWDWEKVITREQRNKTTLRQAVEKIWQVFLDTQAKVCDAFPAISRYLPRKIFFNGDILLWYPPLERAVELSSMGIRVDREALERQLAIRGAEERKNLTFHRMLLEERLPLTMGGGIGQSRICMVLLEKVHIGEVQASVWPEEMIRACGAHGVHLL